MVSGNHIFFFGLFVGPIAWIAATVVWRKNRPATLILAAIGFIAQLAVFAEREKSGELSLARLEKLQKNTKWSVLAETQTSEGAWAAIIQNQQTQKLAGVLLDQKAPEHFSVQNTGFWRWRKTTLAPIFMQED